MYEYQYGGAGSWLRLVFGVKRLWLNTSGLAPCVLCPFVVCLCRYKALGDEAAVGRTLFTAAGAAVILGTHNTHTPQRSQSFQKVPKIQKTRRFKQSRVQSDLSMTDHATAAPPAPNPSPPLFLTQACSSRASWLASPRRP